MTRLRWSIAPWRLAAVFTDGIVCFVWQDGDGGGFQAIVFEHLADVLEVRRVTDVKDGDFHAVVAGGLEFFDDGEIFLGHVTGPEQQVEANFHELRAQQ
jgi:hypothetical protein